MRHIKAGRRALPFVLAGLPCQLSFGGASGFDPLAFDIGPVLIRPQGQLAETYNDNVYYRSGATQVGDFVTTVAPGVDLSLGEFDVNHVAVEYLMPVNLYASQTKLSGINQIVTLDGLYQGSRLTVEGVESYTSRFGLLGGSTEIPTPLRYENYDDSIRFGYDVAGKTTLYAKASYAGQEFEQGFPLIDFSDLRGTFGAAYHYSPQTSFFLEGYAGYVTTHSEDAAVVASGPTARYYGLFAGVQGELATRLTWYAKGGYELRDYSDGSSAPGAIVADLELAYNFNDRTKIDLHYRRANQTSIQYASQTTLADTVGASLTQKFGGAEKLEAAVTLDYYNLAYELGSLNGLTADGLGAGLDVKYHFNDWLTADCRYQFLSFDTTLPGIVNYKVNQYVVMLSVGYVKVPK
jgi:hypothetical protein